MAKKKKAPVEPEHDEIPDGKQDEDGDELIDLYDEADNLEEDLDYDLSQIEDDMLADESEDEEFAGFELPLVLLVLGSLAMIVHLEKRKKR